ncbi:MAG: amidohydrolase family protein [Thermoplasmata archaeon]|nr:amidohydrolase family protein [Thermoplasmata archaeon]
MATRVEADVLIPGTGEPTRNGCVIFDGATISYAGPIESAPPASPSDTTVNVPAVLPGLWDTHTHFTGIRNFTMEEMVYTSPWVGILRAARDAEKVLRLGFTSIRELGGYGIYVGRAVKDGSIPGPHIYGSGTALSTTGGHGDAHAFSLEYVHQEQSRLGFPGPCDGVAECLAAVRKVLRLGAPVVKVCASGGVLSDMDSPVDRQFSDEELRAMVEEAARAERIVAAHCHGKVGIMAALKAGVKTIEHGSYLDDEAADLMLEKGALLVPTRTIVTQLVARKDTGIPEFMIEKARKMVDQHRTALRIAVRKNVPIAMGTDIGGSSEAAAVYWGQNAKELVLLVEDGGMTPLQAIESATANGPRTLGPQAPRSGQLRAGFVADILALREDPLKRIAALTESDNIVRVWKDGQLAVERPLAGPP